MSRSALGPLMYSLVSTGSLAFDELEGAGTGEGAFGVGIGAGCEAVLEEDLAGEVLVSPEGWRQGDAQ